MKITKRGEYRTHNGMHAVITSIEQNKAHGHVCGMYERTLWYANSGEHALSSDYDLIQYLSQKTENADNHNV